MPIDDEEEQTALVKVIASLTEKERNALTQFQKTEGVPISDAKADELLEMFRFGKSCEQITRICRGLSLGQVVAARVFGKWDDRIDTETDAKLQGLPAQVRRVQTDSVEVLTRLLAIMNGVYNDTMDEYLATKNPALIRLLPDTKEFRSILESLLKATGQDNKKVVEHRGTVAVTHAPAPVTEDEAGQYLDDILLLPAKKSE